MAEKPRTPKPPRKVQAPQVRQKQSSQGSALPWTNILIGLGTVVIVGLVVALLVALNGGGGSAKNVTAQEIANVKAAMAKAGCTTRTSPAEASNQHMSEPDQKATYLTFPPGSGLHDSTTAFWGNYRNPADPRQVVHNLEHGGIAVWYGPDISPKDRGELDSFYDESPNGILVTPLEDRSPGIAYPKHQPLGSKIALTVWTADAGKPDSGQVQVSVCPHVDAVAFAAFRDAFRGKGPERFPVSRMLPGEN